MRDKIQEKLKEIDKNVYYGAGKFQDRDFWDCIVFGKRRLKKENNTNVSIWFVAIVREEFIPDGLENEVASKLREIGLKQTETSTDYGYFDKGGDCMVEICTMEFFKSEKRCCL